MKSFLLGKPVDGSFNIPFKVERGRGWTNPYVTDGLVQQYDGIWNAGGGIHADIATVWKDLVGMNDATLTQWATIAPDCLQIQGRSGYAASFRGDITDEYTIETIVLCQIPVDNAPRLTAENPYPSLYFSTSSSPESRFAFYGQGLDAAMAQALVDRTVRHYYSISYNGSSLIAYVDGDFYGISANIPKPSSVTTATIGNRLSGGRGFNGEYCAFRRYNRALTAEEIAANYAIDQVRFNLS